MVILQKLRNGLTVEELNDRVNGIHWSKGIESRLSLLKLNNIIILMYQY